MGVFPSGLPGSGLLTDAVPFFQVWQEDPGKEQVYYYDRG
jgi:hypothetical protein